MCKSKSKEAQFFLKQLKKLDRMISNKMIEKEQWQAIASGTTSHSEGERVQSSGSKQKMADAVDRYVDIEREIDQCIDRLVDAKKDVISVIEQLNTTEYDVLHKVYVQYLTFDDVAADYGKSYSWITSVHGRALVNVQRILDEEMAKEYEKRVGAGYEGLINGIIKQAIQDYEHALRLIRKNPNDIGASHQIASIRKFFRSEWFSFLCDVDGESIIRKTEERFEKLMAKERKNKKCEKV